MDLADLVSTTPAARDLSDTERTILSFLLNNEHLVAESTVTALAQATFSSTASIIRLTQKLGFSGYAEFKYFVKSSLQAPKVTDTDIMADMRHDVLATLDRLDDMDLAQPLTLLRRATVIYLYATGYAQRLAAKDFAKGLMSRRRFAVLLPSAIEFESGLGAMSPNDVVVILTLSGTTPGLESIVTKLHQRGVPTVCITARTDGYIAQAATCCIPYQSTPVPTTNPQGAYRSLVGLNLVTDYVLRRLVALQQEDAEGISHPAVQSPLT
ncbi:MurR/RpiR family transcriptional regulator [Corynebacterium sp. 13CS0277]|uniref:MurR/RpiR family transcriptional regulator n=1 Tax=Corynebacterium sp. 13CS0277 TaxID=2071994 RepID=UPI000D04579A|nr:MurR/RpiR family transcriptional regulator [Corynebacterium sp. 13CS0277]PRQ12218.1 MurR/RpiR family transcriptional regulator [Corynebacterium sp. 13CS0277]